MQFSNRAQVWARLITLVEAVAVVEVRRMEAGWVGEIILSQRSLSSHAALEYGSTLPVSRASVCVVLITLVQFSVY